MFIATFFTIVKLWKQPDAPQLMNGLRKCGIYTQWSIIQPFKVKLYCCREMDGSGEHHVKQNELGSKSQVSHFPHIGC
jgi:hypothetical protein